MSYSMLKEDSNFQFLNVMWYLREVQPCYRSTWSGKLPLQLNRVTCLTVNAFSAKLLDAKSWESKVVVLFRFLHCAKLNVVSASSAAHFVLLCLVWDISKIYSVFEYSNELLKPIVNIIGGLLTSLTVEARRPAVLCSQPHIATKSCFHHCLLQRPYAIHATFSAFFCVRWFVPRLHLCKYLSVSTSQSLLPSFRGAVGFQRRLPPTLHSFVFSSGWGSDQWDCLG